MAPLSVNPDPIQLGGVVPILRVADLQASIDYYVGVLGFALQWRYRDFVASVKQGRCELYLSAGDQGHPGIRLPPTNFPWALETQIEDPDGNILRIASDPEDGPYGEWLDMDGRSWAIEDERERRD